MTVKMVVISAGNTQILQMLRRFSSLLPASAVTAAAMPTIEVATATIGRLDRAATTPTASSSTAALSARPNSTAAVRTGTLSAASRNNKSLRKRGLGIPPVFYSKSLSAPRIENA